MNWNNREEVKEYNLVWREKNKELLKQKKKEYYHKNKKDILNKIKQCRKQNKEKFKAIDKLKYKNNLTKIKIRSKKYYHKNKLKICKHQREYYLGNKENIKKKVSIYRIKNRELINFKIKQKVKSNPQFRKEINLRHALIRAFKSYSKYGKIRNAKNYGINFKAIIKHLKPFPKDIEKYHIDHIIPLSKFDFNDPKQIKWAFAPENHQWLTKEENLKKGDRFIFIKEPKD